VIPLKVKLVNESGQWRVHALEKAPAGLVANAAAPGIPAEDELATMANSSVLQLARAVNANDFSDFHQSIARLWREQTTAEALRDAFRTLIDQKIDLTAIEGRAPEFTEKPMIDDQGRLVLKGRYPLPPTAATFTLKFIFEKSQWKLMGIYVSPGADPNPEALTSIASEMPADSELSALTSGSVLLLATALSRDDFSDFYAGIARLWQGQTTRDKLRDQFKVFMEKKISLTLIEGTAPVFTEKPVVDSNKVLILTGHYPTKPYRVEFRLKFIQEAFQWKLVGINVSTASQ
jgi:hypothetical protein